MTNVPGNWIVIRTEDGTRLCNFYVPENIKFLWNQQESKDNPAHLTGFLDTCSFKVFDPTLNSIVHLMASQLVLF